MIEWWMQNIQIGDITAGTYPLIAVPLTDKSVLSGVDAEDADIIELRVDMFEKLSGEYIKEIVGKAKDTLKKPVITTIRSYTEGGAVRISDKERESLFKAVIKCTDAVDIEIRSEIFNRIVKLAHRHKKTAIGSFHDFVQTPEPDKLSDIFKRGKSFKADIIKIAVMPNSADDLRTITELTLRFHDKGLIAVAMGGLGMSSRIYLPLIGSLMTFASLDIATAPGQLSLKDIKGFLSVSKNSEYCD